MKHIHKKFLFEDKWKQESPFENREFELIDINKFSTKTLQKASKDSFVVIQTTEFDNLYAFLHNHHGKMLTIPMPDLTLVYYDFAYKLNMTRKEVIKEMTDKLSCPERFSEANSDLLYNFYGHSSSCIINLFTTIESFVNSLLPVNKEYRRVSNNKTELFNREQIQKNISFTEKVTKVLPQLLENKNFFKNTTPSTQLITNLKELRDTIVHTKSDDLGKSQVEIFKKLLSYRYDETFEAVRIFLNFYKEGYIVDCPCEKQF